MKSMGKISQPENSYGKIEYRGSRVLKGRGGKMPKRWEKIQILGTHTQQPVDLLSSRIPEVGRENSNSSTTKG